MTLAKDKQHFDLKRVFALYFAVYAVLIIAFYLLAGDQLHFRRSRGEVTMPAAEAGTIELVQGTYVQQTFTARIQRLESVSVQWGTYYRANAGTVTIAGGEERLAPAVKKDAKRIDNLVGKVRREEIPNSFYLAANISEAVSEALKKHKVPESERHERIGNQFAHFD